MDSERETPFASHKEELSHIVMYCGVMTKLPQVPRCIDKETNVEEDDFLPRKEQARTQIQRVEDVVHNYRHEARDDWFLVRIQRPATGELKDIFVYNSRLFPGEDRFLTKFESSSRGKHLFYHGTTITSAKHIIEHGIDVTKTDRYLDFSAGKGFYLTDNYNRACEWSERKITFRYGFRFSEPAVIIFRTDNNFGKNETHVSLNDDNATNMKFWECIVSHFRKKERSPDVTRVLEDVKYIEGPVGCQSCLGQDQIPTPIDNELFHQLCICDQDYATRFGSLQNILGVIFLDSQPFRFRNEYF